MKRRMVVLFMGIILIIGFMFLVRWLVHSKFYQTGSVSEDFLLPKSVVTGAEEDRERQTGGREDNKVQAGKTEGVEIQTEDEEKISVCDMVRAMNFTAKKPQLDITHEENQIYLEGYLRVLRNEIPAIGEVEVKYYEDLWKAGIEFEQLLKEKETREYPYLYYYDDLDGDGKPEFAIEQGCMYLFKYDKELCKCMIQDFEQACYFESFVGAGQIWRHDGLHASVIRDDLIGLGEDGNFQYILRLEKGINPNHSYFEIGIGDDPTYYEDVSEEEWNEITQPFFEMVENNAVPKKTLEEVFGDLLIENTKE